MAKKDKGAEAPADPAVRLESATKAMIRSFRGGSEPTEPVAVEFFEALIGLLIEIYRKP